MDIKPITMKKFLVVLSFLAIGAFVPITNLQACGGTFFICDDYDDFAAQYQQNCLCGSYAVTIDVCNGNQERIVDVPCA